MFVFSCDGTRNIAVEPMPGSTVTSSLSNLLVIEEGGDISGANVCVTLSHRQARNNTTKCDSDGLKR